MSRKTHCKRGHEFSEANTYLRPGGTRLCRACCRMSEGRRVSPRPRPSEARRKRIRAYARKWNAANKERVNEARRPVNRAKYAADPVSHRLRCRDAARRTKAKGTPWYATHCPPKPRQFGPKVGKYFFRARWAKENKDTVNAKTHRYRARKRGAPGEGVSCGQWREILEAYGNRCAYCAKTGSLQMEHVDPTSKGGSHDPSNIVPACPSCNQSKCDKPLIIWLAA